MMNENHDHSLTAEFEEKMKKFCSIAHLEKYEDQEKKKKELKQLSKECEEHQY